MVEARGEAPGGEAAPALDWLVAALDSEPPLEAAAGHGAAAVLIPLLAADAGWEVLFTRRSDTLSSHPGQVSFPGGRVEPHDRGFAAAALRETHEEVGVPPRLVEPLGALPLCRTGTGFSIVPIVARIHGRPGLAPDPREVAEVFTVPLDYLLAPANRHRERALLGGRWREYHVIEYDRWRIWGATARIVVSLADRLRAAPRSRP